MQKEAASLRLKLLQAQKTNLLADKVQAEVTSLQGQVDTIKGRAAAHTMLRSASAKMDKSQEEMYKELLAKHSALQDAHRKSENSNEMLMRRVEHLERDNKEWQRRADKVRGVEARQNDKAHAQALESARMQAREQRMLEEAQAREKKLVDDEATAMRLKDVATREAEQTRVQAEQVAAREHALAERERGFQHMVDMTTA